MLEWKRVQLMITNYTVMDEEFVSKKMLDGLRWKQILELRATAECDAASMSATIFQFMQAAL